MKFKNNEMKFKHQDIEILRTLKPLIKNKIFPQKKNYTQHLERHFWRLTSPNPTPNIKPKTKQKRLIL